MISYWEIALRLGLAIIFGGAVGYERESQNLPAGFRTHILVCVGAVLIMMVSAYGFPGPMSDMVDPSRIAASVVTGIGFLGAGVLRQQGGIRGLTTAQHLGGFGNRTGGGDRLLFRRAAGGAGCIDQLAGPGTPRPGARLLPRQAPYCAHV